MTVSGPRRASRLSHFTLGAALVAAALLTAGEAHAWYFPEHVVIAHDGLMQLPPELRDVLQDAVSRSRREGLRLCARVDLPIEDFAQKRALDTHMIHVDSGLDCVPYSALPALAGDHANSTAELREVIMSQKGIEIASAAAYEWGRFEAALARLPNASLERMSFVHALDVDFYFIDPGYELRAQATQAHFVDGGRRIEDAVREIAATGNVDNALGQFLAHHLRSLELAARGGVTEALLEHGFAMHFLQDAFAAGHLVMTEETWRSGNAHARRRHDFFNAKGLGVDRAMGVEPCPALGAGSLELAELTPCWVTSGDGYLGTSPDASDRIHAARAATKAELELALAIDPERVVSVVEALGEREQLALGQLVEPVPWWTVRASERRKLRASASRTLRLVRGAASAVGRLRVAPLMRAIEVGARPSPGLFDAHVLAEALDVCKPLDEVDPTLTDAADVAPCEPNRALALGTAGVSLLRPMLVEWPSSQAPASALQGESKQDFGWAAQLLAAGSATVLFPPRDPVVFFAPAIGVSAGVSYRWGTYLPGRLNRSIAEFNVGISTALQYDSRGTSGGNPHVTLLDQELRWPIAWELLTSYMLPLDIAKGHEAGGVLFLNGVKVHELVTNPTPVFWGFELEAAAIALSRGQGQYPLYTASPELRLYVGVANPRAVEPSFSGTWGPTVGIELTGGYATFF
jgi:hypothetical protein